MGTTVLAAPAMNRAKEKLGADLFFVIFARNVESLELLGLVPPENVFTIRDTSLFYLAWDTLAFSCGRGVIASTPLSILSCSRVSPHYWRDFRARPAASASTGFTTKDCTAAKC